MHSSLSGFMPGAAAGQTVILIRAASVCVSPIRIEGDKLSLPPYPAICGASRCRPSSMYLPDTGLCRTSGAAALSRFLYRHNLFGFRLHQLVHVLAEFVGQLLQLTLQLLDLILGNVFLPKLL